MTEYRYEPRSKRISANIDGTRLDLSPVIDTLEGLGKSITKDPQNKSLTQVIHHNGWRDVCPYELHGTATKASQKFRSTMHPEFNQDLIELASTEIGLGNIPITKWDHSVYDEQILTELDNIGKTWQYTLDRAQAEEEVRMHGLPIVMPLNHLSEEKRFQAYRTSYRFIDKDSLVGDAVKTYDKAMLSKKHPEKERFEAMELDNLSIGIGLNLYNQGIAKLKLYDDN